MAKINPRFFEPVPTAFSLEEEVRRLVQAAKVHYTIEQRVRDGAWVHKSNYGSDEAHALRNARWFRQLLRGKVEFRVCVCLGDAKSVILGEVSR